MSELALVSAKRLRLERRAEEGSRGARAAIALAEDPSNFLSTVQVGITVIGIFNGAFGEASLASTLAAHLESVPLVAPYARETATGLVVVFITIASIIFGELVPKRIAMRYPEAMAILIAPTLRLLSVIMSPFVKLLSLSTNAIVRVLGIHQTKEEAPTEEDIAGIIKEGADTGVFEKTEYDIVQRALRLDDQHLKSLMTPRVDLIILDLEEDRARNLETIATNPYSRFPVCRGDRSHILGYVMARDLFAQAVRTGSLDSVDLEGAVEELLYVPETVSAMALLEMFKKNRAELALIVDEYGDIQGMVTLSDVMSALVGDVTVTGEESEADAVQRPDGSWLVDGGVALDRFRDLLESRLEFPGEDEGAYHTLAGFMLYQLGYIPKPAEIVDWEGFRFEVMDMDGNRIDRILVSRYVRIAPEPSATEPVAPEIAIDTLALGPFVLPTAVLLMAAGILVASLLADWFRRRRHADPGPILWKMILAGFVVARALFVLRHHDLFAERPWTALDLRDGGFDTTAGLLVACVVGAELSRRHAALRRPLLASSLAGLAIWLGGTMALQVFAPANAPLPQLGVRRLDGSETPLRAWRGKPLVVNLWASWCPPCRREMPALAATQRKRPDLHFVFVNQRESAAQVASFLAAQGLRMENVVLDPAGQLGARTGSVGFPTTLFYDAQGMLRARHVGELSEATLREKLAAIEG